jgi:hypothetical protein
MEITLGTEQTVFDPNDVRIVLRAALNNEMILARARRNAYERTCQEFEGRFQITSDRFLEDFEAGHLGDDLEYFDWYAAKRAFDLWDRRARILAGVTV